MDFFGCQILVFCELDTSNGHNTSISAIQVGRANMGGNIIESV